MLAGNTLAMLYSGFTDSLNVFHYTVVTLLIGLFVYVFAFDYRMYFALDPEKRDRLYDPQKIGHASWWPTFNEIGKYLEQNTPKNAKVMVLGHAARIYNKSNREAFFYMPSFNPFKAEEAGIAEYAMFMEEITKDYPEVFVLAGHMPAFPFNPKPYLQDMKNISKKSGIVYIGRKVIDNFPIYFADLEKSYISALIRGGFNNERLKSEKPEISNLILDLENKLRQGAAEHALIEFIENLKKERRFEDIVHTIIEISNINRFNFSQKHLESLLLTLGVAQYEMGKIEESEKTFQEIVKRNPNSCEAHNNLGIIYFSQKKYPEAAKTFEYVLKNDPNNAAAKENLRATTYQLESATR